jgi:hypothetical protein
MLRPEVDPIDDDELRSIRRAFRPRRFDATAFSALSALADASLNFNVVGAVSDGAGAGAAGGFDAWTLGAPRHIQRCLRLLLCNSLKCILDLLLMERLEMQDYFACPNVCPDAPIVVGKRRTFVREHAVQILKKSSVNCGLICLLQF